MASCRISVGTLPQSAAHTLVVIDALRAASTIVTACALGVGEIVPVADAHQARRMAAAGTVLGGESGGRQLAGFEINNSPVALERRWQRGAFGRLVLCTTNLVPLLARCSRALICSSLNLRAVAAAVAGADLHIVAAGGSHGAAEDLAVALALAAVHGGADLPAGTTTAGIRESAAARHLAAIGCGDDVRFCAREDVYVVVPVYDGTSVRAGQCHG